MPNWKQDTAHVNTEQFRHHVTIQENQPTGTGSRGESLTNWVDVYKAVPAAIQPLTGRELELAKAQMVNATHRITTRYLPNVSAINWRIQWQGETFTIGYVQNPDYRNRVLIITAYSESSP